MLNLLLLQKLSHCLLILAASHSLLTDVLLLHWRILQIMNHGGWQAVPLLQALRGAMHLINYFWILNEGRYPSPSVPGSDLSGEERFKHELYLILASMHQLGTWRQVIENDMRTAFALNWISCTYILDGAGQQMQYLGNKTELHEIDTQVDVTRYANTSH